MLSRKYRFHSRGGVRYTYKHGKTLRAAELALVFAPNTRGFQRFAVSVSKKVLKSAVGRNRIRRRVYEALRLELSWYQARNDCILVIYSKDLISMPFEELRAKVHGLLEQSLV